MRFEAKHNFAKRLSSVVCCFKDICKTVTLRHQISHCCNWVANSKRDKDRLYVGEVTAVCISDLEGCEVILDKVPWFDLNDEIFVANSVALYGTQYRQGMIIVVGWEMELPSFCEITAVLAVEDQCILLHGHKLQTLHFNVHLHAYAVQKSGQYSSTEIRSLRDFHPLHLTRFGTSSELFVALRYEVL